MKFKDVIIGILVGMAVYCFISSITKEPYYRDGGSFYGISGWEFGVILLVIFGLITVRFLREKYTGDVSPPSMKYVKKIVKFCLIGAFMLFFGTQIVEIGIRNRTCWLEEVVGVGSESATREIVCTIGFCVAILGVLIGIIAPLIVTVGEVVNHEKSVRPVFTTFFYIMGSTFLAFTTWTYLSWFILTKGDSHLFESLADGTTYGYFVVARWGIFFSSAEELLFHM